MALLVNGSQALDVLHDAHAHQCDPSETISWPIPLIALRFLGSAPDSMV